MTPTQAKEILALLKDDDAESPDYDDVIEWLEDACQTIVMKASVVKEAK